MITAATAAADNTQKDRAVAARPFADYFNSSTTEDSSNRLQLQFLTAQFGLSAVRASLVAALAWGGRNG